jgi:hypothetical protein
MGCDIVVAARIRKILPMGTDRKKERKRRKKREGGGEGGGRKGEGKREVCGGFKPKFQTKFSSSANCILKISLVQPKLCSSTSVLSEAGGLKNIYGGTWEKRRGKGGKGAKKRKEIGRICARKAKIANFVPLLIFRWQALNNSEANFSLALCSFTRCREMMPPYLAPGV